MIRQLSIHFRGMFQNTYEAELGRQKVQDSLYPALIPVPKIC